MLAKLALSESTVAIDLAIGEAEQVIKNYCTLSYIPGELVFVWANMAPDILAKDAAVSEDGGLPHCGEVLTSVSVGDTSYGFASKENRLAKIRDDYAGQLNRFRKGLFGDD